MKAISKRTGTFKSFDQTKIYFEDRGEGDPIILVYGIGCVINHWIHQINHFSKKRRVIVFDYRAHHRSDLPKNLNHMSLDDCAKDIEQLLIHLKIEKADFVGHSFGVQLLIRFYELYPNRVRSLSFINGFVKNPLAKMFGNDMASKIFKYLKDGFEMMPETISTFWRVAVQSPLSVHLSALAGGFNLKLTSLKDIEIYARGVANMNLGAFLRMFEYMMTFDGSHVLETIKIPTLVIAGKKDSVTPSDIQKKMHEAIPNSEWLLVPYGSHCTQLDMPELVNLRIDQFLKDVDNFVD